MSKLNNDKCAKSILDFRGALTEEQYFGYLKGCAIACITEQRYAKAKEYIDAMIAFENDILNDIEPQL